MEQKDLIGTWKLASYKITWESSEKMIYPFGEDAVGYLIYTADGFVSVLIKRAHRPKCSFDDFRAMSIPEKIEMADNSGGYIGRYEMVGSTLIHKPEASIFPNFIHVPQIRQYRYSPQQLILECDYEGEGEKPGLSQLVWKRISKGE